jgi:hypothetical protein
MAPQGIISAQGEAVIRSFKRAKRIWSDTAEN